MSYRIVILGAGISGLATAWFLKQSLPSAHLTILEKNSRAGGWIQTLGEGPFLFEQGPHSFRSKGAGKETLALVEALGLQQEVICPSTQSKNRYIYNGQHLERLPRRLWEVPFSSLTRGWCRALWRDWSMPKRKQDDESIQMFFQRRLGQEWGDRLIDPFVLGIFAGDYKKLSLKSCFPLFDQWEQQQGSLLRGAWSHRPVKTSSPFIQSISRFPLLSFKGGMETLPRALACKLKDHLQLNREVKHLMIESEAVKIILTDGEELLAERVISTLPTFTLSRLLSSYPFVANQLEQLHYATVYVVNIGFSGDVLRWQGFGYLVPSHLGLPLLGCVWDSSIFPQQHQEQQLTRLTLMIGGAQHPESEQMSEEEVLEYALKILDQQLNISVRPESVQIKKASRAIPQYEVGYERWKEKLEEAIDHLSPRLILSGSAFTGVSINDCIGQARLLSKEPENRQNLNVERGLMVS